MPQRCLLHCRQLSLHSQQIRRVPHAAPHQSALLTRRFTIQVSNDVVWHSCLGLGTRCWHADCCHTHRLLCPCCQGGCCMLVRYAAPAPKQPDEQSEPEVTKQCLRCGETRSLFYFPVRKSHPNGWVHCFACQYELRLQVKPPRRCAPLLHTTYWKELLIALCGLQRVFTVLHHTRHSCESFVCHVSIRNPATLLLLQSHVHHSLIAACTLHRVEHNEHAPTDEPQDCRKCHRGTWRQDGFP